MARVRRLKRRFKRWIESLLKVRIYSSHPHGRDDCNDLQRSGVDIRTILDVGANDGSSALKFRNAFPDSVIHAFEPVAGTFDLLRRNLRSMPAVHCYQVALGAAPGQARIYLTRHSTTNSLVPPDDVRGVETVQVTTVDQFAREHGLEGIDLLKIDAEGFDLHVLEGATGMLGSGRIKFALVEVGFHRGDSRHVLFDDVRDFLVARGFAVFGIYDQQPEWSGEKRLRYANVCFSHAGEPIDADRTLKAPMSP
jgi:FkbM family methyltransferase